MFALQSKNLIKKRFRKLKFYTYYLNVIDHIFLKKCLSHRNNKHIIANCNDKKIICM